MKTGIAWVIGFFTGIIVVPLGCLAYLGFGWMDVSAMTRAGALEERLSEMAREASIRKRATEGKAPASSAEGLAAGLAHYRENCFVCHGAPGMKRSEIAMGLNPAPPDLSMETVQARSDGELFWITSQGIRMTGMPAFAPTHGEDEIWAIIAFLRHLPSLTTEERAELETAMEADHHDHGAAETLEPQHRHGPGAPPNPH